MVPEIVESKLEKGKDVAPTDCGTASDHCEKFELVVADEVVDERGKNLSTTMGTKSSYHGRGYGFGITVWVDSVCSSCNSLCGWCYYSAENKPEQESGELCS